MNTEYLINIQLNLACVRRNARGYLVQFQCDNPDPAARLYIYHDAQDYYRFIRDDVPSVLREHLKLLRETTVFNEIAQIQQTLGEHKPCNTIFRGKTYIFPKEALNLAYDDSEIVYDGSTCQIIQNNEIVAFCASVREDGAAAEAWVYTHDAHRGKNYGQIVALAWARRVAQKGKIPFYTHSIDNLSSQKLVEKLPFIWRYDLVAYR